MKLLALVTLSLCGCTGPLMLGTTGQNESCTQGSCGNDAGPVVGGPDAGMTFTKVAPANKGSIEISRAGSNGSYQMEVFAFFVAGESLDCEERTDGPCHITRCSSATEAGTRVLAGTIEQSSSLGSSVVPVGSSNQSYLLFQSGFPAGQDVAVTASGGVSPDAPAFAGTISVPGETPTLTNPAGATPNMNVPLGAPLSKASPFSLDWTPVNGVDVVVKVAQTDAGAQQPALSIECTFDGSAGTATISPSALADLSTTPATQGGPTTVASIAAESMHTVTAGSFTVDLRGFAPQGPYIGIFSFPSVTP